MKEVIVSPNAVKNLNDHIGTYEEITITLAAGITTDEFCYIRKQGRTYSISVDIGKTGGIAGGSVIGTYDRTKFAPTETVYIPAFGYNGAWNTAGMLGFAANNNNVTWYGANSVTYIKANGTVMI